MAATARKVRSQSLSLKHSCPGKKFDVFSNFTGPVSLVKKIPNFIGCDNVAFCYGRILGPRSCWPGTSLVQSTRSSVTGSIYVMVEALRKTTQKIRQDEARCIHNLFRSPPGDDAMSM